MIAKAIDCPTVAAPQKMEGVDPAREARGQRIASSTSIVADDEGWIIPSDSRPGVYYRIWMDENGYHCSCHDPFRTCKHVAALQLTLNGGRKAKTVPSLASAPVVSTVERHPSTSQSSGLLEMPADSPASPERLTYWQAYTRAQTNEGKLFPQILRALCELVPEPASQGRGRPQTSVRDLIFGETMREYAGLSSRRFHTAIREAANDGYIVKAYGYNTGTDFLNLTGTTDLLRALITETARPLRGIERTFAIDSSGFGTRTYDRWYDEKYGSERMRGAYVKTHIFVGVQSRIITAAAASVETVGDITMMRPLLEETRRAQFTVAQLLADSAYRSEEMLKWLHELGIDTWVPFHNNAVFHYDGSLWDRQLTMFMFHQDKFAEHYHQRSQAETAYSMIKCKYGASVRGKKATSQANGVLVKVLAHNLYVLIRAIYEIGLETDFAQMEAVPRPAP